MNRLVPVKAGKIGPTHLQTTTALVTFSLVKEVLLLTPCSTIKEAIHHIKIRNKSPTRVLVGFQSMHINLADNL